MYVLQAASTSRASIGAPTHRGAGSVGNPRANPVTESPRRTNTPNRRAHRDRGTADVVPKVLALREGEPLPDGYKYVVCEPVQPTTIENTTEMVDLTTPPEDTVRTPGEDVDASKPLLQNTSFIPTPISLHVFYYYEE